MSFLSGILDPGNQHLAGQVKGTGFRVDQAAYGIILPQFEQLSSMGLNNLNSYGRGITAVGGRHQGKGAAST